jgi:hypothetical protein
VSVELRHVFMATTRPGWACRLVAYVLLVIALALIAQLLTVGLMG